MSRNYVPFNSSISGYTVIKNSWRGRYKRLMSITTDCVATYNPQTMELTNSWNYDEIYAFSQNFRSNPQEFMINVPKYKGAKPSQMFFQTPYIKEIMSDIYSQYRKFRFYEESLEKNFVGNKICSDGTIKHVNLICTPCSVDIWSTNTRKLFKKYYYKDIASLHHISDQNQTVAIKSVFDERMTAYTVNDAQSFIETLIDFASKYLEISILLANSLKKDQYFSNRLGAYHENDLLTILVSFKVEKYSRFQQDMVSRILAITENGIFERDPSTYNVITVLPILRIFSFYRSVENMLIFGIEWKDSGRPMSVYKCNERDSLIASFLDVTRLCGNSNAYVHSTLLSKNVRYSPLSDFVDEEVEISCIKSLISDFASSEKVSIFNINIPYTGFQHAHCPDSLFGQKKEKLIHDAISSILQTEDYPNISSSKFENLFMALKRLFSSKAGFDSFVPMKYYEKFGTMMNVGCNKNDSAITYAAVEALNALLIPFHPNSDQYSEQKNRVCLLSHSVFIKFLLSILKNNIIHKTNSLIIFALLDTINFSICMPYSLTTYEEELKMFINHLIEVGSPLFKLFNHSSPSIVKSIGIIIKTILDESDADIVKKIQEMALREGIFPKHLLSSLYTPLMDSKKLNKFVVFNRQMSRQLLVYWVMDSPIVKMLLYRSMPPGLVNFLYSDEKISESALALELERENIQLNIENKREIDVFIRNLVGDTGQLLKHWHSKVYESITGTEIKGDKPLRIVNLRQPKPPKQAKENWNVFYYNFTKDFNNPELIWNNKTREELREALEATIRGFFMDQDLGNECRVSWNYEDFDVLYQSLKNEIMIGDYYLVPLMEEKAFNLLSPKKFFSQLYHVFLQHQTLEMKVACIKAMTSIFAKYHEKIGMFKDIMYINHQLLHVKSRYERDLFILLLKELVLNKENARIFISSNQLQNLIDVAILAHLHITRAPVPLQTLMIEGPFTDESVTPVWFLNFDGKTSEAFSFNAINEKYNNKEIDENIKLWAHGMDGWRPLKDIPQLKWTIVYSDPPIYNETDLSIHILDLIIRACKFFPNVDKNNSIVRPLPKCSRFLTNIACLPHLVQLLLTFDPSIVEKVATILNAIMIENPVLSKLYISGCYFFMLMYTGSNISPIAKFLKATHLKQAYTGDQHKKNKMLTNSILSPLLPEAMIAYIESYDHSEFAKAFLGEYDNPELIWSNEMRRYLIEKISIHLADFIPNLKSNVKSIYIYCPIPRIEYNELQGELFCRRYYLKHLCDTVKFPNWKIDEPLETLRDILETWQFEVNKKPSQSMTINSAYQILELDPEQSHEQSIVRRAYLKLVSKYHPDKNPDGQEIFEKIVDAYEYICNHILINETPSVENILLLIKSQSILFVNYKKELEPYKYSAYPLLLETIITELKNEDIFSTNQEKLILLYALRLAHHTLSCSGLNAEELRRENGVNVLSSVFDRCINFITKMSVPEDSNILIIEEVIRCFIASCRFSGFINVIIEIPQIFQNFNHILFHYKNILNLCCTTVECITALCSSEVVHLKLLKYGIIYHLIYYLFVYDYTLSESGKELHDDSNIQVKLNEFANLCLISLSVMFANSALTMPLNVESDKNYIVKLLSRFLSPYIVQRLSSFSYHDLLKLLNTNTESPLIIWNNSTRSQLKKLLNDIRYYNPDSEEKNFERAMSHEYEENKSQLIVGNIYIYIFNKNPTFRIENSKKICISFLHFIEENAKYIHSAINSKNVEGTLDKKIQDVYDVMLAVHHLIRQELYPEIFDKNVLLILFSFFSIQRCKNIQVVVLKIINILVSQATCVITISKASVLGHLNLATHFLVDERKIIFEIFHVLFSNNAIVSESISKGTIVYLLDIFCQNKDIIIRTSIVELFARLLSNKASGPRFQIIMQRFLPKIFLDAIFDDIQSVSLLYESQQENPELLWNNERRDILTNNVSKLKNELLALQMQDQNATYEIPTDFKCFNNADDGIYLGNVNVQRYIAQPTWVLRHPRDFLCGLFDSLYPIYNEKRLIDTCEDMETITTALCLFLNHNPLQCDQLPSLGHMHKIINYLDRGEPGSSIVKSNLRILNSCSNTRSCVLDMCKNEKWLYALLQSFEKRPDCTLIAAAIINNCFRQEIPSVSSYVIRNDFLPKLIDLLKQPFTDVDKPQEVKALIINGVQALEKEPISGRRITELLKEIPEWKQYKFQKHDLFIDQGDASHLLLQNAAGVAGYLTAAQNTSQTAYSSTTAIKMIYDTQPPKPFQDP